MNDKHIIKTFDSGEKTSLVEKELFCLDPVTMSKDYEDNILSLTKNVIELNERKAFLEGVAQYFGDFDVSDTEGMLAEVKKRYAAKGIELKKSTKNWFRKKDCSPSTNTDRENRKNLYNFCFALDMDYQATAKFFLKSFFTIPFNYKDKIDAVYFYCIKKGYDYSKVQKFLKEADSFCDINTDVSCTEHIGIQILSIEDDDEFIQYLKNHCYDKKHQYKTAKEKIAKLIDKNKKIVPGKDYDGFDNLGTKSNSGLLNAILGYRYQNLDEKQRNKMNECVLPSFPRDGDISKVMKPDNEASFDVLRKTLIVMYFYNYYRNKQVKDRNYDMKNRGEVQDCLWEFLDGINCELFKCGFTQMYARNPFDWIILFCSNSMNPIECLHGFIEEQYLSGADG